MAKANLVTLSLSLNKYVCLREIPLSRDMFAPEAQLPKEEQYLVYCIIKSDHRF